MNYVSNAVTSVAKQGENACYYNAKFVTDKLNCDERDYLESTAWIWTHNNFDYNKFYAKFGYDPDNQEWQISLRYELSKMVDKYMKPHVLY